MSAASDVNFGPYTAEDLHAQPFFGGDVLLAVEVVSRGSGSEREDRVRKMTEYAQTGIPRYWIVDFDPEASIQVHVLDQGVYRLDRTVGEGATMEVDTPVTVAFDPAELVAWKNA